MNIEGLFLIIICYLLSNNLRLGFKTFLSLFETWDNILSFLSYHITVTLIRLKLYGRLVEHGIESETVFYLFKVPGNEPRADWNAAQEFYFINLLCYISYWATCHLIF